MGLAGEIFDMPIQSFETINESNIADILNVLNVLYSSEPFPEAIRDAYSAKSQDLLNASTQKTQDSADVVSLFGNFAIAKAA